MAIPEIIAQAKQVDVIDLVSRYTPLEKVGGHEWAGPCPKCKGNDRLHAKVDGWFCRQCKPIDGNHGWHDAVDFMRWVDGLSFQEATERLANQQWPERKPHVNQPKKQRMDERTDDWFANAEATLQRHQADLADSEGADYLRGRALHPKTWAAFGLGYAPEVKNRDMDGALPAIALPWYRGGKLTAIRYRFLNPPGKQKISSLPDSKFGGVLFGSQGLPDWVLAPVADGERSVTQHCTLVICEGEINAMSIWQVAHHTNLHVVSMGSESSKLTSGMVALAARYGQVIIWMDKPEIAKKLMEQAPGAFGFGSPEGKDANDLLQAGTLGGQLVALRWQAARTDDERQRLFWDLWDGANEGGGLDKSTAAAFGKLCPYMGREFDLVEVDGVWVTKG